MTRKSDDPAEALADELLLAERLGNNREMIVRSLEQGRTYKVWTRRELLAAIRRQYPNRETVLLKCQHCGGLSLLDGLKSIPVKGAIEVEKPPQRRRRKRKP